MGSWLGLVLGVIAPESDRQERLCSVRTWVYWVAQTKTRTNSTLPLHELDVVAPLTWAGRRLPESAAVDLGLSARACVKVLRVAHTSADLAGKDEIDDFHVEEALQGRLSDYRVVRKLPTNEAPAA
jgi:predicted ATPase with chaperone activity